MTKKDLVITAEPVAGAPLPAAPPAGSGTAAQPSAPARAAHVTAPASATTLDLGNLFAAPASASASTSASASAAAAPVPAAETARRGTALAAMAAASSAAGRSHWAHFAASHDELAALRAARAGAQDAWSSDASLGDAVLKGRRVAWARLAEVLGPNFRIVREEGFAPEDVEQGSVGDCWLLAGVAEVAQQAPAALDAAFVATDAHASGWHAVRLWSRGAWQLVLVDDRLPCETDCYRKLGADGHIDEAHNWAGAPDPAQGRFYVPICAKPRRGAAWVPLFEKAVAKLNASYANIASGLGHELFDMLCPHALPGFRIDTRDVTAATLAPKLRRWLARGWMLSTSTYPSTQAEADEIMKHGLAFSHGYSLLRVVEVPEADPQAAALRARPLRRKAELEGFDSKASDEFDAENLHLVQLRNPHASEEWKGRWADGDAAWTAAARAATGYDAAAADADDGLFWMSAFDFTKSFTFVDVFRQNELEGDGRGGRWRAVFQRGAFLRPNALPGSYLVSQCAAFAQFLLVLDAAGPGASGGGSGGSGGGGGGGGSGGGGSDDDEVSIVLRVEQDVIDKSLARKDPRASASIFVVACRGGAAPAAPLSAEAMRSASNAAGGAGRSSDTSFVVTLRVRAADGPWVVIPTFFEELYAEKRCYTLGVWATAPLRLAPL